MRISENPIIHYGALAGAAMAIIGLVTAVGFNITPPWITQAQATEITRVAVGNLQTRYDAILQALQDNQRQLKMRDLDASIIDTQARECKAEHDHNAEAARFATDRINFLRDQYFAAAQREYVAPSCAALGL